MTAVVVPAIPTVDLPDGPYYTQLPVTGTCTNCDRQALANISYVNCEWRLDTNGDVVPVPETNVGMAVWSCGWHLGFAIRDAMGYAATGTDVTVELDNRWLALAGVYDLPTFVRRAAS